MRSWGSAATTGNRLPATAQAAAGAAISGWALGWPAAVGRAHPCTCPWPFCRAARGAIGSGGVDCWRFHSWRRAMCRQTSSLPRTRQHNRRRQKSCLQLPSTRPVVRRVCGAMGEGCLVTHMASFVRVDATVQQQPSNVNVTTTRCLEDGRFSVLRVRANKPHRRC